MAAVELEPANPSPRKGWQITTATAPDLVEALATIAAAGYTGTVICTPGADPASPVWEMRIGRPGELTQVGVITDWIVYDPVDGSAGIYSDEQCRTKFTPTQPTQGW